LTQGIKMCRLLASVLLLGSSETTSNTAFAAFQSDKSALGQDCGRVSSRDHVFCTAIDIVHRQR
jgi:hypothetical protein